MKDQNKTKKQLIQELEALRKKLPELEKSTDKRKRAEEELLKHRDHLAEEAAERKKAMVELREKTEMLQHQDWIKNSNRERQEGNHTMNFDKRTKCFSQNLGEILW